ncbi:hypothetical protein Salmuc_01325 [Salipiger mucosus DSM 16094]|uniref:Uncharacterized protein n=1 Tax=Salipiger mucosus DSM 16094 TaxID=1123237 RepID=S9QYT2_9RHOB|nr:hypothetical protein [Salipiger mucosus]EPX84752.1 hypothetical protein Salmuc_01325 [Salipiger mucosus DSM 16094]
MEALEDYDGYTDIAFNPKTGLNCQARAAAMYVSLVKRGLLNEALSSPEAILALTAADEASKAPSAEADQMSFGF